ncbi:MAG: hypothetical protein J6D03_11430 [Clostridia bacterium]|nr:hypothetical protein [Clostridia bacterium]MBO5005796.1 hypothetical protein [Clostridia bacterium]
MEYIYVDLNNDFEEFVLAKISIEKFWISEKIIESKLSIDEFVSKLNMHKTVYSDTSDEIIPFSIIETSKTKYIFTVADNNIDNLKKALEYIEYDLSNLIRVTKEDLYINNVIEDKSYFIIDNKVCLPSKSYKASYDINKTIQLKYDNIKPEYIEETVVKNILVEDNQI